METLSRQLMAFLTLCVCSKSAILDMTYLTYQRPYYDGKDSICINYSKRDILVTYMYHVCFKLLLLPKNTESV